MKRLSIFIVMMAAIPASVSFAQVKTNSLTERSFSATSNDPYGVNAFFDAFEQLEDAFEDEQNRRKLFSAVDLVDYKIVDVIVTRTAYEIKVELKVLFFYRLTGVPNPLLYPEEDSGP